MAIAEYPRQGDLFKKKSCFFFFFDSVLEAGELKSMHSRMAFSSGEGVLRTSAGCDAQTL